MFTKICIIAILFTSALCLENVVQLNDHNFQELVLDDETQKWIVLFAAQWCGHCQRLKPEFEKLATLLQEHGVKLGHANENNQKLVNDYVVNHQTHMVSYPNIYGFNGVSKKVKAPSNARTVETLLKWAEVEFELKEQEPTAEENGIVIVEETEQQKKDQATKQEAKEEKAQTVQQTKEQDSEGESDQQKDQQRDENDDDQDDQSDDNQDQGDDDGKKQDDNDNSDL